MIIQPRTAVAVATAGIATLAGGIISGSRPKPGYNEMPSGATFTALGLAMGGTLTGVMIGTTAPGRSLKPVAAPVLAALGAFLLGEKLIGPLLGGRD
jgi:hypothetical protein